MCMKPSVFNSHNQLDIKIAVFIEPALSGLCIFTINPSMYNSTLCPALAGLFASHSGVLSC